MPGICKRCGLAEDALCPAGHPIHEPFLDDWILQHHPFEREGSRP